MSTPGKQNESKPDYQLVGSPAATPVADSIPMTTGVPMVEVVAPATLAEGYTFEADAGGRTFTVSVPQGGVEEGQRFLAPLSTPSTANPSSAGIATIHSNIPTGRWRDGLCDCFHYGCCHPLLCVAFWCEPIALAQIMTRMRLNWLGHEGNVRQVARTFKTVLFLFVAFIALDHALSIMLMSYIPKHDDDDYTPQPLPTEAMVMYYFRQLLQLSFAVYILYAMTVTRAYIRNKYSIPEHCCRGCEDCCCSLWCTCCTVSQMARHTADYDTYAAQCCTQTGLPSHVPAIV